MADSVSVCQDNICESKYGWFRLHFVKTTIVYQNGGFSLKFVETTFVKITNPRFHEQRDVKLLNIPRDN